MSRNNRGFLCGVALLGVARLLACEPGPPPDIEPTRVPVLASSTVAGAGRGVRVDLRDQARHVRALERQPDGTYKSVCINAPEALRPAPRRAGAGDGAGGAGAPR